MSKLRPLNYDIRSASFFIYIFILIMFKYYMIRVRCFAALFFMIDVNFIFMINVTFFSYDANDGFVFTFKNLNFLKRERRVISTTLCINFHLNRSLSWEKCAMPAVT